MTAGIDPSAPPSGTGCAECDVAGGWWVHLRRCAACGHIGCCDDSLAKHATAHWRASGHPIIRSFEPGEDWFWNYEVDDYCEGPELATPESHPAGQGVPGPRGRVPGNWQELLLRGRNTQGCNRTRHRRPPEPNSLVVQPLPQSLPDAALVACCRRSGFDRDEFG